MDLEGQPAIVDACQRARRRTLNEDGRFSHSFLVRSYNGHYLGLSIRRREFDSPTHRQVLLFAVSRSPINIKLRLQQQIYFHMNKPY